VATDALTQQCMGTSHSEGSGAGKRQSSALSGQCVGMVPVKVLSATPGIEHAMLWSNSSDGFGTAGLATEALSRQCVGTDTAMEWALAATRCIDQAIHWSGPSNDNWRHSRMATGALSRQRVGIVTAMAWRRPEQHLVH